MNNQAIGSLCKLQSGKNSSDFIYSQIRVKWLKIWCQDALNLSVRENFAGQFLILYTNPRSIWKDQTLGPLTFRYFSLLGIFSFNVMFSLISCYALRWSMVELITETSSTKNRAVWQYVNALLFDRNSLEPLKNNRRFQLTVYRRLSDPKFTDNLSYNVQIVKSIKLCYRLTFGTVNKLSLRKVPSVAHFFGNIVFTLLKWVDLFSVEYRIVLNKMYYCTVLKRISLQYEMI